jgi:hypothetical protein
VASIICTRVDDQMASATDDTNLFIAHLLAPSTQGKHALIETIHWA